jgi:cytochrome P450
LRGLINKGFTPRMTRKLEDVFSQIVTETLDQVASKGSCDFVDDIAVPPPLLIIAEMIGIRPDDRDQFHEWSDSMILAQGNMDNPAAIERAGKDTRG